MGLFFPLRSDAQQVLEYMGGGDLLNLSKFPEDFTRFYVVQVQRLFQPRDVKPDVRFVLAV
jgi:hypothetical protein